MVRKLILLFTLFSLLSCSQYIGELVGQSPQVHLEIGEAIDSRDLLFLENSEGVLWQYNGVNIYDISNKKHSMYNPPHGITIMSFDVLLDGRTIVYEGLDLGFQIFVDDIENNDPIQITNGPLNRRVVRAHPFLNQISYGEGEQNKYQLILMDLETNKTRTIGETAFIYDMVWSPDGQWIALLVNGKEDDTKTLKIADLNIEQMTDLVVDHPCLFLGNFSFKSDYLAYSICVNQDQNSMYKLKNIELSTGQEADRIINIARHISEPWAHQANKLTFSMKVDGIEDVFIFDTDQDILTNITQSQSSSEYFPRWSPNDQSLIYFRNQPGKAFDFAALIYRELTTAREHNLKTWTTE